MTQAGLARAMSYTRSLVVMVEKGGRRPTPDFAAAADAALGLDGVLAALRLVDEGDDMHRRTALTAFAGAAAGVAAATADGSAALAAVLRGGLDAATGRDTDWDALAADFARRHVLAPSDALRAELHGQLIVAQGQLAGNPAACRGAAVMAMTLGLMIGDTGRIPSAWSHYRTARALAEVSADRTTVAGVRARAASRGLYEGMPVADAREHIGAALDLAPTSPGALEAHAAAVHLAALTGDLPAGRAAVAAMYRLAEQLPAAEGAPAPVQRAASFHSYLECRIGPPAAAERAYTAAVPLLAPVPLWAADAALYRGRSLARAGEPAAGVTLALDAIRSLPGPVRVLGVGVADLLAALPAGYRSAEVDALRAYAATGPMPWDMIRA